MTRRVGDDAPLSCLVVEVCHCRGKLFFGDSCRMAHTQAVVVNGLERVLEELGYASRIGDSDAHEGIDAQFGGEAPLLGGPNLLSSLSKVLKRSIKSGYARRKALSNCL